MILMQGKGVSKGVIKGKLYFFQRPDTTVAMRQVDDVEAEKQRLAQAQETTVQQLNILAEKAREDAGEEIAILFDTHAMFVEDEDYVECILSCLEEEGCNAEYAVQMAGEARPCSTANSTKGTFFLGLRLGLLLRILQIRHTAEHWKRYE